MIYNEAHPLNREEEDTHVCTLQSEHMCTYVCTYKCITVEIYVD